MSKTPCLGTSWTEQLGFRAESGPEDIPYHMIYQWVRKIQGNQGSGTAVKPVTLSKKRFIGEEGQLGEHREAVSDAQTQTVES